MKKVYLLLLLCCVNIAASFAQVSGTKTIGVDYPTLAAAITALNTGGVSGAVTINVPAGYTETAPAGGYLLGSTTLNQSITAVNTLTIRKNGAGANPLLTAPVGVSTSIDGIFFIKGTDYLTIDGIDLTESAANTTTTTQMEWGYALVKLQNTAPFDGCQNVNIRNCSITLNITNSATVGIYANNHIATSTTALSITATTDAMNNCTFYSNTIQNCNTGISLRGYSSAPSPYTLYDQNNDIGGSSLATGNTIQNYAGTNTGSGINIQYQNVPNIAYNNINNIAGTGGVAATSTLYGIYIQNGTNTNINTLFNTINLTMGSTSSTMYGVNVSCSGTGTINVNNNTLTANGGTTGSMYMIYLSSSNTNVNTNNNNFYNINVALTTGTLALIYHSSASSTANITCNNNFTSGPATPYINKTGSGGTFYGYYNNASSSAGFAIINGNNFSNMAFGGTGSFTFYGAFEHNGGSGQTKIVNGNIVSNITSTSTSTSTVIYALSIGYSLTQSISNCQVFNINGGAGTVYGLETYFNALTDSVYNCHAYNLTSTGNSVYGLYCANSGSTTMRIYNDTVNTLSTSAASGNTYGIYQTVGTTIEIYRNKIYDLAGTGTSSSVNGIYVSTGNATIYNNLIGDLRTPNLNSSSGTQLDGINLSGGTTHNVYYNTINLNATSTGAAFGSSGVYISTGPNVTLRNNVIVNTSTAVGAGLTVAYRRTGTTLTSYQAASNNNLFYAGTPGASNLIFNDGTNSYQTMASYKTAMATRDQSSVTENPPFLSTTGSSANFLHISTATPTQIESGAVNIAGITTDFDGNIRAGNTGYAGPAPAPDMGACEGNYTINDLVPPVATYTALSSGCGTGDRVFTVNITDGTGVPTTGGLVPRVYFKKNSGSYFSTAGVLSSGTAKNGTWTFTITAASMGGLAVSDIVSYYIIAQDIVGTPNIGATPGAGLVASDVNTVSTHPTAPNTYTIVPVLSGTYNVGVGQTYATITAAAAAYNSSCVSGNVVFQLTDATYGASETFPITFNTNVSASASNTLTIKPAAGIAAVINGTAAASAIFKLQNASYITIDGVNTGGASLTLNGANTGTASDIWLGSTAGTGPGCNFITLKNMNINGGSNTTASDWGIIACDGASIGGNNAPDNDNITITGNTFTKVGYAVFSVGTAITSAGGNDNWVVSNNIVGPVVSSNATNAGVNGMFFRNMVNLQITGNTLRNIGITTNTFGLAGFYLEANVNRAVVTGNTITNMAAFGTGTSYGILFGNTVINSIASRNTFTTMHNDNTGGASVRAITVSTTVAASNDTIVNNMISDLYGYTSSTVANNPIGIAIENGATGGVSVWDNTINIFGSHVGVSGTGATYCLYIVSTGNNLDVRNNIFTNTYDNTTSSLDKSYAVYSTAASSQFSNMDYNDYFVSGPNILGVIGGTDRNTLATMQAGFGGNTHSVNISPAFFSATDLHLSNVASNLPLVAGTPISAVTIDFNGNTRSATTPVMGAHEATLANFPPIMSYTALSNTCSTGDQTLIATISDAFSGVPTTGPNVPRVYYRKNAGSWFSRPGFLTSGNGTSGTWNFTIASGDMGGVTGNDVVSYYLVSQTNATYVGSNPAAGFVGTSVNSVTTPPTTPNTYSVLPVNGTFNVGVGQTFTTITQAVNAYNNNTCLGGPIVLNLTDATYPSETFPITINNNPLASAFATLTIKPATGVAVTINGSASGASVFKLLNARYVTIDGVNASGSSLTLNNPNTGTSAGIWLSSSGTGCNNITLTNMNIIGGSNTVTGDWGIVAGVDGSTPANTNGADNDNITITNNTFTKVGYAIWTSGTTALSAGGNDNWTVAGNIVGPAVSNAATNIGVNGMFFRNMVNLSITNNTLQNIGVSTNNFGLAGFYLESNVNRAVITGNTITNMAANTTNTSLGINMGTTVINSIVSKNTFTTLHNDNTTATAIRCILVNTGTAASNDTIVNNMISDIYNYGGTASGSNPTGIDIEGSSGGVCVWHNSVNFASSHAGFNGITTSYCLYITTSGSNLDIRNNIFSNTSINTANAGAKNYAVLSTAAASQFLFSDFNDLYVSGGANVLAILGGVDFTTLSSIQTASGANSHSVNVNPNFISGTNLHIPAGTVSRLESGGFNVGVTTDFDNQVRPGPIPVTFGGGTAVDIGADEFDGVIQDVVPPAITYTPLTSSCNTLDRVVTAVITDATGVNNTASLKPRIFFKKNSGAYVSAQGSLTSGTAINGTWSFTISTAALSGLAVGDIVSYYIVAQDVASTPNIGATPSGGFVAGADVNAAGTPPTTPSSYAIFNTLSGTYNVGVGQTYATITAAVTAYNNSCLSGPVTFQLMDATYAASETFPITINNSIYASASNTLTIKPAAGVAATINGGAASTAIFKFLNAQYITIDGVNTGGSSLTLNGNNTGTFTDLWLASTSGTGPGCNFISLKNMNINGGSNTTTSDWAILSGVDGASPSSTSGFNNDNITISGNTIMKCGYPIYANGTAAVSAGGLDNWVISNNTFGPSAYNTANNIGYNGMFLQNMLNVTINDNTIQYVGLTGQLSTTNGINLVSNINGALVNHNNINNITNANSGNGTGSTAGIVLGNGVINTTVSRNNLNTISTTTSNGYGVRAIIVNTASNTSNDIISNNNISNIFSTADNSNIYWTIGIDIDGASGGIGVYYNTVNLSGTYVGYTSATGSAALFLNSTGTGIDIRDNIFVNTFDNTNTATDKGWAIYSTVSNAGISNIDYNDYYASAPDVAGNIGGSDRPDLASIQAGFGSNTHSQNVLPSFVSITDGHLQAVAANVSFLNSGTPISGITIDFNGNTRSAVTPVIGMHEVNIPSCGSISAGFVTAVNPVLCVSGTTTVNANSITTGLGMSYQWQSSSDSVSWTAISGATTTSYVIPTAITANTYYRIKANCSISGNKDSATLKVRVAPLPTIAVTPDGGAYCSGSTLTMGASGANTFTWSPASGLSSTNSSVVTTNTSSTTVYTVTGTDINGCTNTHVSTVTVTATPFAATITAAQSSFCSGGSTQLSATATLPPVIFADDFNSTLSAWAIDNTGSTNAGTIPLTQWKVQPNGYNYASVETFHSPDNSQFAMTNADPAGSSSTTHSIMTSPAFSLAGYTSATLTYQHYLRSTNSSDVVKVEISTNGGSSWSTLQNYPGGTNAGSASSFASVNISLNSYLGQSNVKIRFNYQSPWNWYWLVDNLSITGVGSYPNISWSPAADLYNDAALTSPYTGAITSTVYAAPTAPTVTTNTTYVANVINGTCINNSGTKTLTVNPLPAANTGVHNVCIGGTTTLSNTVTGGTWSTTSTNISVVGSTGVITGITASTTNPVTYTLGSGCTRISNITVNPLPAAITGNADVCIGATNMLADATPGGTWNSSASGTATISNIGALGGVIAGNATISYTLSTGCMATVVATVNVLPVVNVTPATMPTVCMGANVPFTASAPVSGINLLAQDFNSGIGTWSVTSTSGAPVSNWHIVPSPSSTGPVGDGTPMMQADATSSGGVDITILTSPGFSTIGYASANLTFNESMLTDGTDVAISVEYSVNNGPWTVLQNQTLPVNATGVPSWSAGSPEINIPLPAPAIGQSNVRLRWNYNASSFYWTIDNINVNALPPAATYAWTGNVADLTCTNCANPTITPSALGLNAYSVTATTSHNCMTTVPVTVSVNPMPSAIGGTAVVCQFATTTLTNTQNGGTWTSSLPGTAFVAASTGIVTGVAPGTATITYTLTGGCFTTIDVTVNQTPLPITAPAPLCSGTTSNLVETVTGGTWSTTTPSVATVSNTGVVTAVAEGTADINYTMSTGCKAGVTITVNPTPSAISGILAVCEGATTGLSNSLNGGTWSSSAPANGSIDMTTGVVTGIVAGTTAITYAMPTGCWNSTNVTVNTTPVAIAGLPAVCEGATTALSDATSVGIWTSTAPATASVNGIGVVSGNIAGIATISYTLITGCYAATDVTVNPTPTAIVTAGGPFTVCEGAMLSVSSTPLGGTWSSSVPAAGTIDASGNISGILAGTTNVVYTLPAGCTANQMVTINPSPSAVSGTLTVCEGFTTTLGNTVSGGNWSSGNLSVATINATTGVVTGANAGQAAVTYTLPAGCYAFDVVSVNATPAPVTGVSSICQGATTDYTDASGTGVWSSSNSAVAIIDAAGHTAALTVGSANISYTFTATGCYAMQNLVVHTSPVAISGTPVACEGQTTTLSNATTGGTWSSTNTGVATVSATGVVTAVLAGNADIVYTMPGACTTSVTATVNPSPAAITGTASICQNATTTLSNTVTGGTWASSTPGVATVNTSGLVSGVSGGTATITYTLPAGCNTNQVVTINISVPAVSVAQNITGTICQGTSVTFTATPVNGGTTPVYTWRVNGATAATTGNTYTYSPANGDIVKTVLHSNHACAIPDSAVNTTTMSISPMVTPAITVSANPGTNICKNTVVTYTSTAVNGGTAPQYTWVVNGTVVNTTSTSYTYTPNDLDIVYCMLTSNADCRIDSVAYSNNELMTVDPGLIPIVNIKPLNTYIGNGEIDSFVAMVTNGGAHPGYKWFINAVAVSGATNGTFSSGALHNNDSITVQVISDGPCGLSTFNSVVIKVRTTGVTPVATTESDLRLIPNPNNGDFVVSGTLGTTTDEEVSMEITDMLGQTVYKGNVMSHAGSINERIKLSNTLANGMYMLNVKTASENKAFHFVLKQ